MYKMIKTTALLATIHSVLTFNRSSLALLTSISDIYQSRESLAQIHTTMGHCLLNQRTLQQLPTSTLFLS